MGWRLPGRWRGWAMLLAAVLVSGCTTVAARHPVGTAADPAEVVALEGAWEINSQGHVVAKALPDNRLRVAMLVWRDEEFKKEEFTFVVTKVKEDLYLNLERPTPAQGEGKAPRDTPDTPPPATQPAGEPAMRYEPMLIRRVGEEGSSMFCMWGLDHQLVKQAIEAGKLPGRVDGSNYLVDADAAAWTRFVVPEGSAPLRWREPAVLLRLGKLP